MTRSSAAAWSHCSRSRRGAICRRRNRSSSRNTHRLCGLPPLPRRIRPPFIRSGDFPASPFSPDENAELRRKVWSRIEHDRTRTIFGWRGLSRNTAALAAAAALAVAPSRRRHGRPRRRGSAMDRRRGSFTRRGSSAAAAGAPAAAAGVPVAAAGACVPTRGSRAGEHPVVPAGLPSPPNRCASSSRPLIRTSGSSGWSGPPPTRSSRFCPTSSQPTTQPTEQAKSRPTP